MATEVTCADCKKPMKRGEYYFCRQFCRRDKCDVAAADGPDAHYHHRSQARCQAPEAARET